MKRSLLAAVALLIAHPAFAQYYQGGNAAATSPLTYSTTTSYTSNTTSGVLFAAGTFTKVVLLCTLPSSTSNVWLNLSGGTAVVNTGTFVPKGGGCIAIGTQATPMPTSAVTSITDSTSSQSLSVSGG